jgi:hypothetical protein
VGLFSFVGKAIKGVGKLVGTAAKIAGGLGIIPGGGLIGKAANILLASKNPMSTTGTKLQLRSPTFMRGNVTQGGYGGAARQTFGVRPPAAILRASPVMPGGAFATPSGMAPRSAAPPAAYSGAGGAPKKRRKKTTRSTTKRRTRSKGRKLKFGSPAWRKKYLGKRRRRKAA